MKKFLISLVCVVFMSFAFAWCSVADDIEEGTYICQNPYIKYTSDLSADYHITQEIEIDNKVCKPLHLLIFLQGCFLLNIKKKM